MRNGKHEGITAIVVALWLGGLGGAYAAAKYYDTSNADGLTAGAALPPDMQECLAQLRK